MEGKERQGGQAVLEQPATAARPEQDRRRTPTIPAPGRRRRSRAGSARRSGGSSCRDDPDRTPACGARSCPLQASPRPARTIRRRAGAKATPAGSCANARRCAGRCELFGDSGLTQDQPLRLVLETIARSQGHDPSGVQILSLYPWSSPEWQRSTTRFCGQGSVLARTPASLRGIRRIGWRSSRRRNILLGMGRVATPAQGAVAISMSQRG